MKNRKEAIAKKELNRIERVPCEINAINGSNLEGDTLQSIIESETPNLPLLDDQVLSALYEYLESVDPNFTPENPDNAIEYALDLFTKQNRLCEKLSTENEKISELLANNPRVYLLLENLLNGDPVSVALVKSDMLDVTPEQDDNDYSDYILAVSQVRERNRQAKEMTHQRECRCEECKQVSQQFYQDIDANEQEIEQFVQFLGSIIDNIFNANIDRQLLTILWKAFTFDREVQEAHAEGVIDGRNQAITIRKNYRTDGIPAQSTAGSKIVKEAKQGYIERLLRNR